MVKKTKELFNTSLHNLLPNHIPYDKKFHDGIAPYIEENLWKHMDKDRVKKAVLVLDDPLYEYGNDYEMIKMLMKNFVPKVKKLLKIDKEHQLKDMLGDNISIPDFIDRNIKQRINLYINNKNTRGNIVEILQE